MGEMAGTSGVRKNELRDLFEHVLAELDGDERSGSVLRAAGFRLCLEVTDLDLVIRVDASDKGAQHIAWAFEEDQIGRPADFSLAMDSGTVNGYLQGQVSLPVAIAHGRVRWSGESRTPLVYLPVLRMLSEPYRRWVHQLHPHLALG
ncbi:MAG: hypothetical protein WKF62_06425, partial [Solirubrobacterales bacterium]